jgi:DNA invertase Pin-like site-specific DNA recombinase
MIYGYARVSTGAQDLGNQLAQLKAAGCGKVFREKITGTTADRPQLKKLMRVLTAGDVVITPAVDRLSRDATDLLVIARDMQRAGAGLRSIAEPVVDTTSDFAELVLAMLGVAAKLECRRILERTARGRADARPRASNSAASRRSPRTSNRRPANASPPARRIAASPGATTSVRRRFRGCEHDHLPVYPRRRPPRISTVLHPPQPRLRSRATRRALPLY